MIIKVFCINCKHYRRKEYYIKPQIRHLCNLSKKLIDSAVKKFNTYDYCTYINKDNDCKNYKRKWWKIWV